MANIGVDEWVSEVDSRTEHATGIRARGKQMLGRMPQLAPLWVLIVVGAFFPLMGPTDYSLAVGVNALVIALLALGLNITYGWAGLLDLSYVAFFGIGAYAYAMLSSEQFGIHEPTIVAVLAAMAAAGVFGLLLALSSRRLRGDYFAILTLFFAQIFATFTISGDKVPLFGTHNITNGSGGIVPVDPVTIFGQQIVTMKGYFWLLLALIAIAVLAFSGIQRSKVGRAWNAQREDPLAAGAMGTPVFKLRILAVVFGAATAGLVGSVFASLQVGVYPQSFDITLLVTVFAMLVAGGTGSIAGAIVGPVAIDVALEGLRSPSTATWMFAIAVILGLVFAIKPRWRALAVIAATIVLGIAIHAIVAGVATIGHPAVSSHGLRHLIDTWTVLLPGGSDGIGMWAVVALLAAGLLFTELKRPIARLIALPFLLYLGFFVWQNVLVTQPSVTRQIILGGGLVLLIVLRPQGLLGTRRVEGVDT